MSAWYADADSVRDDLIDSRQFAGKFAVGFEPDLSIIISGANRDLTGERVVDLAQIEMCAAVERVGVDEYLGGTDIADIYHIQKSVIDLGLRSDHHPAAEVARVGDAEVDRL